MPTYRLTVEYEGTRYSGWQEQKNARTVAGELKQALAPLVPVPFELGGAGRTDAGVHALAQVAHLRSPVALEPERALAAVNDALPPDIHLLALEPAETRFHARHDALSRSYVYQICRRRTALGKRFVWWVKRPLDAQSMSAALEAVVGRHDFSRFAERNPDPDASPLVEVESAEVAEAGDLVLVRVVASHFLWKMVRRLVGALVEVGAGGLEVERFRALVEMARTPVAERPAEWTAPPSGLFLERILYAGDPPLGALAAPMPVTSPPAAARAESSRSAPRPRARPDRSSAPGHRGRGAAPRGRGPRSRR